MSLLEKLMEKKDLDTYLRLRIRRLKQEITERIDKYPEKQREQVIKTTEARIKELCKLGDALRSNNIKKKCKMMWKHFNYLGDNTNLQKGNDEKMVITEVKRLCTKCIEEKGIQQPMFYEENGKLKTHIHKEDI